MIIVTTPLELTRAMMDSVVPVERLEIELKELPVTATPLEVNTGTSCPTFMIAGMLSVAMMLGEEMMRDLFWLSAAETASSSSWLRSTRAPTDSVAPPLLAAVRHAAAGAAFFCR